MDLEFGNSVRLSVPLAEQRDEIVQAAVAEGMDVLRARGLNPETAGAAAVAAEVSVADEVTTEQPERTVTRESLLESLTEGAELYRSLITGINEGRSEQDKIPALSDEQYREQAEGWLTPERLAAAAELPQTPERPLLLIPRLNHPVTHEEILAAWEAASDDGLYKWGGQLEFLQQFPADSLSGYDPALGEDAGFVILPTAYDATRQGNRKVQNKNLKALQSAHSAIEVAPTLDGALLARRYKGKGQSRNWRDSYVRGIDQKPVEVDRDDYVVHAIVYDDGKAYVRDSHVDSGNAARLRVGS